MATKDTNQQEQDEFSASFDHDIQPTEVSENEAFGIQDDAPDGTETPDAESPAEDAAEGGVEEPGEATPGEVEAAEASGEPGVAPSVAIVIEPGAEDGGDVGAEDVPDPKDVQREKSWEGRLKAKEAELKAREDALAAKSGEPASEPNEPGETAAQESAEPAVTEAMEDAMEKVDSGELTFEQALATLSNDFGPDFTKMLSVMIDARASEIAGKTAEEKVSKVAKAQDDLVHEIVSDKERAHFKSISSAHPDFMEVGASPEFKAYVESLPGTEQEQALNVINGGSADQINSLLSGYKQSIAQGDKPSEPDPVDEKSISAAEGVRSAGIKIPERPAPAQDYEDAWNSFN